ncbi:MAG: hypothetical protein JXR68_10645 [Bacteroidales bacterium]|nr:hypothetical protein [Bacteroidales bacterium]
MMKTRHLTLGLMQAIWSIFASPTASQKMPQPACPSPFSVSISGNLCAEMILKEHFNK